MKQPPPPPEPRYLPPEALLAAYEKLAGAGWRAAAIRLEMLRRNIAATEGATP